VSHDSTSVSPELVLVDPGLGEWAREQLPAPPDTLEALAVARTTAAPATSGRRPRRWRRRLLAATVLAAVLAGGAFLVGSRTDVDDSTAARLPVIGEEPQPPAAPTPEPASPPPPPAPSPAPTGAATGTRRFVWAPVANATGYHVELFKGAALIFRDETTKPEVLIPSRWRFDGGLRSLRPGEYRWYVWPVEGGKRQAEAIVQAKLVVPGS
jgi:hypothetical protein